MQRQASRRLRLAGTVLVALTVVGLAIGFGVAQNTVVTEAEWAVYMAQGLGLDWNMPDNAKSNHYLARLDWTNSVEFEADRMLEGSTARPAGEGAIRADADSLDPVEALYEMSTLRPGDYGLRVKLAGGQALLRVSGQSFDLYQPHGEPRWVDLERVSLDAGRHPMSLILSGGASAAALGVSPPCMLPVEPTGGWRPLEPLRFQEMAVTLAKALELESDLPELGEPHTIRGEEFIRTFVYPFEESGDDGGVAEPFWLASGGSIVTAVVRFEVAEAGVYSIETRYISSRPLRWNVDSCLRVVTCPVVPSQVGRRRSLALQLDAGEHELEVTLPPGAKLDRVEVQRRDGSPAEYVRVVEDEGFKMGAVEELVTRREALGAARRLRDRFADVVSARCEDTLIAMEASAAAAKLQSANASTDAVEGLPAVAPPATAGATQTTFADPVFPPVEGEEPGTASPVQP